MKKRYLVILALLVGAFFFFRKGEAPVAEKKEDPAEVSVSSSMVEKGIVSPPPPVEASSSAPQLSKAEEEAQKRAEEVRGQIKTSLAAVYSAEKSFYSEFRRYTTDLRSTGWFPEESVFKYKLGFLASFDPEDMPDTEEPRFLDTDAYLVGERNGQDPYQYDEPTKDISLSSLQQHCTHRCTASKHYFELIAAANLDADPTLDVWLMTADNTLEHVIDDLKE